MRDAYRRPYDLLIIEQVLARVEETEELEEVFLFDNHEFIMSTLVRELDRLDFCHPTILELELRSGVLSTRTSVTRFKDPVMGELVSFPYGVKYGGLQIPNGALDNEIMNLALRLD